MVCEVSWLREKLLFNQERQPEEQEDKTTVRYIIGKLQDFFKKKKKNTNEADESVKTKTENRIT